ncbi:DNA polymerase III subunit delta [Piscinibacter sakaiensis]|uniref:DNA polymerase III subunit delta n=1 Tax=Piscinibacter sakaiensis TaxID=1547922 RepID=A0A0K8NYP8_PISS1|nr:DNA polymerase III subunit delta [Piscinibacter sakaiensis]GAP35527.1 DNA polymerase III, delta subunit [Piscinibacter sakaiensis]
MQLRADRLAEHLAQAAARDGLRPLYTVWGDEALLVQEAADAVRSAARAAGHGERQVHTVAGAHFDWSGLLGAAQSMSLFSERQLVELRIPSGKPGKDGADALQRYCERLPPDVLTLVQLPRLDRQQQQSGWFTALDGAGVSVRIDPVDRAALPAWIAQRLARQGQRVADGEDGERALAWFADRVEGNLLAAHQEIQKLALLHPPGVLPGEAIEAAVLDVARFDTAQFGEAVLGGRLGRALRMLEALQAEGEAAVLVHWTLAEDIRALLRGREAMDAGKPLPLALREARVWGRKERLYERLLPALRSAALAPLLQEAQVCDGIVKGLRHPDWPHEPWAALRRLTIALVLRLRAR